MSEELQSLTQAALLFAVVFVLMAIGIVVVRRFRDSKDDDMAESSSMMTKFRDLHDEGGLSDDEFRTIKSKLATKLRAEMKDVSPSASTKSVSN
jgi:uncharacterized membrane protein